MRISDWSSDVCSSDLAIALHRIDTEGSGMLTWAKVLLGIIVVIVAIAVAVFFFTSGLTKTADEFFAAARKGNVEQAYQYTSPAFKAGTTRDELAAFRKATAPRSEERRVRNDGGRTCRYRW